MLEIKIIADMEDSSLLRYFCNVSQEIKNPEDLVGSLKAIPGIYKVTVGEPCVLTIHVSCCCLVLGKEDYRIAMNKVAATIMEHFSISKNKAHVVIQTSLNIENEFLPTGTRRIDHGLVLGIIS